MAKSPSWASIAKKVLPLVADAVGASGRKGREDPSPVLEALVGRKGVLGDNEALGVSLAAGAAIAQRLYARPGFRATLDSVVHKVTTGQRETIADPPEAARQADWIVSLFRRVGRRPQRLAVDGVPGSGKSTLARALAKALGMQWRSLDHMNLDVPLDLSEAGTVYEHHRLLRTQDVDGFEAIIYIDEPVEVSKEKVLRRRRGGYLVEIMDYDRLKRVGRHAFSVAAGKELRVPDSDVRIKLRPDGGFRIRANAVAELQAQGLAAGNLSQEQALFLCTENEARKGFLAYVNAGACARDILAGVGSALEAREKKKR